MISTIFTGLGFLFLAVAVILFLRAVLAVAGR
jgi:hypothetical protein